MSTTSKFRFGVPLAIASLGFVGCAGMKGETVSSAEQSALLAQKDQEIQRLSSEMSAMEKNLSEEQKARMALAGSAKDPEMLPPGAKPGQCFARAFVAPTYEIDSVRVLKSDASKRIETIPAKYEWAQEKVLVKEASERLETVPATYGWVEEKLLVKPASSRFVTVPASYRTVSERVLDKPEHTVWKKGDGPISRIDEATGEIMCLVTVPATYKTITRKVLVEDAVSKEVEIPAEYTTVRKRVMKTPPTTRKVVIPAEYKTVKVRKLVKPAATNTVEIPAQYETIQKRNKLTDGHMEWRPVLCRTNMTTDVVRSIQTALDKAGFAPGPIDGFIGQQTMAAVKQYQKAKGLATGGLTIQTLDSLKVNL